MDIIFDPIKSQNNERNRQLPFDKVIHFDWNNAIYTEDMRFNYGEKRIQAIGFLNNRAHVICFTQIIDVVRIISFRKANKREIKYYEEKRKAQAANEPKW